MFVKEDGFGTIAQKGGQCASLFRAGSKKRSDNETFHSVFSKSEINTLNVNGRDYDYRLYVLTPACREIGRGFCYSLRDFNILWNVVNDGTFDFNLVLGVRLISEA